MDFEPPDSSGGSFVVLTGASFFLEFRGVAVGLLLGVSGTLGFGFSGAMSAVNETFDRRELARGWVLAR